MTILEFEEKLNTVYQTLFGKQLPDANNNSSNTTGFDVLEPFITTLVIKDLPFFLFKKDTQDAIEFIINNRSADLFSIGKNELQKDKEPIPFIKIDEEWQSYEFNLYTLLFTEYVHWLSSQTTNSFELSFSGYDIYVPVKKHWDQFFNPFSYPNKIWIGKEIKSVIYIQNETGTLTCMTNNAETLKQAQELLIEK